MELTLKYVLIRYEEKNEEIRRTKFKNIINISFKTLYGNIFFAKQFYNNRNVYLYAIRPIFMGLFIVMKL